MTEILGPILMMLASTCFYYSDNKDYFYNFDCVSEADFQRGLLYMGIDVVIQSIVFIGLAVYVKRVLYLDVMRIGFFLAKRHWAYYLSVPFGAMIYFNSVFLVSFLYLHTFEGIYSVCDTTTSAFFPLLTFFAVVILVIK